MIDYPIKNWSEYLPDSFEYNGKWIKNWFSNFTPCLVCIDQIWYNSVEAYYQGQKSVNPDTWKRFSMLNSTEAKREGRKLLIRKDWEEIKYDIMKKGLWAKFLSKEWKDKLLATGNEMIIEWNNWGDEVWGVDVRSCNGKNILGILLMEIRDKLK